MRRTMTVFAVAVLTTFALVVPNAAAAPPDRLDVIVVLHDDFDPGSVARDHGVDLSFLYEHALNGFAGAVPEGRLNGLRHDPRVDYVEFDRVVTIAAEPNPADEQVMPTGLPRAYATSNTTLNIDGVDDLRVDVDVAVLDTGIDYEHPDLDVWPGVNCARGGPWGGGCVSGGDDDHYHGTHVAGTIGAIDNGVGVVGVAPGARLWPVKVLDKNGRGYTSWIIGGIDWVAANADTIEVANMSLGGSGFSQAEYDAIQAAVDAGVAFAVAAGNSADDARFYSPAAFDNVLTVSALADFDGVPGGNGSPTCRADEDDTLANFSNWGTAVDLAAPGVCILSTYPLEKGSYASISGTSMASPHAAGGLALLASSQTPQAGQSLAAFVSSLYAQLEAAGNVDWEDCLNCDDPEEFWSDNDPEPLLDVRSLSASMVQGAVGGPDTQAPISYFTVSCVELTCTFDGSGASDNVGVTAWDWSFGDTMDGAGEVVTHAYPEFGEYTVTLTVADGAGNTDTATQKVSVQADTDAPTASFTVTCADLTCTFDATSSTDNVAVNSWAWEFGDAQMGSGEVVVHAYDAAGTYIVKLTAGDPTGNTGTSSGTASPTDPPPFNLNAYPSKEKGRHVIDLVWSGVAADAFDVYRDGQWIETVGPWSYTDRTGNKGGRSYTYQVCVAGMSECSNTAVATF